MEEMRISVGRVLFFLRRSLSWLQPSRISETNLLFLRKSRTFVTHRFARTKRYFRPYKPDFRKSATFRSADRTMENMVRREERWCLNEPRHRKLWKMRFHFLSGSNDSKLEVTLRQTYANTTLPRITLDWYVASEIFPQTDACRL